jgi:hypothetical protein
MMPCVNPVAMAGIIRDAVIASENNPTYEIFFIVFSEAVTKTT